MNLEKGTRLKVWRHFLSSQDHVTANIKSIRWVKRVKTTGRISPFWMYWDFVLFNCFRHLHNCFLFLSFSILQVRSGDIVVAAVGVAEMVKVSKINDIHYNVWLICASNRNNTEWLFSDNLGMKIHEDFEGFYLISVSPLLQTDYYIII